MNELEFLYDHGYIDMPMMIQNFYLRLGLSETHGMILQLLYAQEQANEPFLAIHTLASKTSMDTNQVSVIVNDLLEKDCLSINTYDHEGQSEEVYSVFPTLLQILQTSNDGGHLQKQETMKLMEAELKRPLSSKEIQIIDGWTYDFLMIKAAVLAAIKQQKVGVEYVNKILENQAQEPKDLSYFDQFLDK
jgi:DNA replication protein